MCHAVYRGQCSKIMPWNPFIARTPHRHKSFPFKQFIFCKNKSTMPSAHRLLPLPWSSPRPVGWRTWPWQSRAAWAACLCPELCSNPGGKMQICKKHVQHNQRSSQIYSSFFTQQENNAHSGKVWGNGDEITIIYRIKFTHSFQTLEYFDRKQCTNSSILYW